MLSSSIDSCASCQPCRRTEVIRRCPSPDRIEAFSARQQKAELPSYSVVHDRRALRAPDEERLDFWRGDANRSLSGKPKEARRRSRLGRLGGADELAQLGQRWAEIAVLLSHTLVLRSAYYFGNFQTTSMSAMMTRWYRAMTEGPVTPSHLATSSGYLHATTPAAAANCSVEQGHGPTWPARLRASINCFANAFLQMPDRCANV